MTERPSAPIMEHAELNASKIRVEHLDQDEIDKSVNNHMTIKNWLKSFLNNIDMLRRLPIKYHRTFAVINNGQALFMNDTVSKHL